MYNWIESTFNVSGGVTQAIAVILALAAVLLLFGLFIFILKRLTGGNVSQSRSRQPRIAVMDSATVDTRRRLVLVRRDNVEHLILIGGPSDVVVEQNIIRNAPLSARPGPQQTQGSAGLSIKSPMAPGPDIPIRPDDSATSVEPAAPPKPAAAAPMPAPQIAPARVTPPAEPPTTTKTPPPPLASPVKSSLETKREPSLPDSRPGTTRKEETSGDNGR
ncbi:flagellar biosynthetic protein FliO, partial [Roseibium sp.]|uniref:flagellar biosynthetic protein FliO n=1 Tax=Roseibium sp. TaxID=1936156 RepID=UPI00261C6070